MAEHNELGSEGEEIAVKELLSKGYSVLHRNWRSGRNEIDIVARIGDVAVFVEVKTRSTDFFGDPAEFISIHQQKRLLQAANNYLEQEELELEARFDIFSIVKNNQGLKTEHIEDAFYPMA